MTPWRKTHLRAWRDHSGLSLEKAAASFGMKHSALSRIERGLAPYNQRVLEGAAKTYGCSVQDLLTRGPTEPPSILDLWGKLDEASRRRATRVISALAEADA